jgi:hypothetical protein
MVYFYDDMAANQSLLMSKKMWRARVRPSHIRLSVEVANCSFVHGDGGGAAGGQHALKDAYRVASGSLMDLAPESERSTYDSRE